MAEQFTATEQEILGHFRDAGKEIYAVVQNMDASNKGVMYRKQQLRAIAEIIARLDAEAKQWADENIPGVMEEAAAEVLKEIKNQGESDFSFNFAGVPQEAVDILTQKAYLDFANTMIGLKKSGERAVLDKRALAGKIVQGVITGSSVSKTQKELLQNLRENGIDVLRTRNGLAPIALEPYTNMLVRTQTMRAYNTAASQQLLMAGRRYGIFPTIPALHRPPDDPCWYWEKKKYVDLLKDPLPPESTHPNCRHHVIPISFAQLKEERPDLYKAALAYYNKAADQ